MTDKKTWPILTRQTRWKYSKKWMEDAVRNDQKLGRPYNGPVPGATHWIDLQREIEKLPTPVDLDEVDKIVDQGLDLTHPICDECEKGVDAVLRLGSPEPSYDYMTIDICFDCLSRARKKLAFETDPE